jgi:hypothetical protein
VIGGVVLLQQGLKPATKDIDLVIHGKREFVAFEHALITAGFEGKIPMDVYKKMNLSQILVRDDSESRQKTSNHNEISIGEPPSRFMISLPLHFTKNRKVY